MIWCHCNQVCGCKDWHPSKDRGDNWDAPAQVGQFLIYTSTIKFSKLREFDAADLRNQNFFGGSLFQSFDVWLLEITQGKSVQRPPTRDFTRVPTLKNEWLVPMIWCHCNQVCGCKDWHPSRGRGDNWAVPHQEVQFLTYTSTKNVQKCESLTLQTYENRVFMVVPCSKVLMCGYRKSP